MAGEIVAMFGKHQSIMREVWVGEELAPINILRVYYAPRVAGGSEPRAGPGAAPPERARWLHDE